MVFFGSYDGTFYALDAKSGKVRWTHRSGGKISGSPTIVGDVVYYADLGRAITVGLKTGSGKVAFRYPIGAYDPIVSDGVNLYLTGNRSLTALEPRRLYEQAPRRPSRRRCARRRRVARALVSPAWPRDVPPAGAVRAAGGGARPPHPDARLMAVTRPGLGPTLPDALRERFGIPPVVTLAVAGVVALAAVAAILRRAHAPAVARRAGRARAAAGLQPALPARARCARPGRGGGELLRLEGRREGLEVSGGPSSAGAAAASTATSRTACCRSTPTASWRPPSAACRGWRSSRRAARGSTTPSATRSATRG